jgi:hypothetical protein
MPTGPVSKNIERSACGAKDSGNDLEQGGFAGPVRSYNRQSLPGLDSECKILQR